MHKDYYISFDTLEMPGKIVAVKVTIEKEIISDMDRPLRVDLSCNPLYGHLVKYVNSNPEV